MNIRGWMDDLLLELADEGDEINLLFFKERCYLPEAEYKHQRDRIGVRGNGPSLARLGLAYLIAHELGHRKHAKLYDGDTGDDYSDQFLKIEREYIEKVWDMCLMEHEEE